MQVIETGWHCVCNSSQTTGIGAGLLAADLVIAQLLLGGLG